MIAILGCGAAGSLIAGDPVGAGAAVRGFPVGTRAKYLDVEIL